MIELNRLITSGLTENQYHILTDEQELMLQMSEEDILYGRTISQDKLKKQTEKWLESNSFQK